MGAYAPTRWIGSALQLLPGPLLRLADAWSHRVALRRREQRQQAWLRRNMPTTPEAPLHYQLKPWRD